MGIVPKGRAKRINWYKVHVNRWLQDPQGIGATPGQARPEIIPNSYVLDAVIDPPLGSGKHQYKERSATRVYTEVYTTGGQIKAGLCRSSYNPVKSVSPAAGASAILSDSKSVKYLYDLAVKGFTSSNRYALDASWWIPGWEVGAFGPAPTGSQKDCNVQ